MDPKNAREMLHKHDAARVIFTKADGTERSMLCTRNDRMIPDVAKPTGKMQLSEDDQQVRVFDLEKREWRSFNAERVLDFIPIDDLTETFGPI